MLFLGFYRVLLFRGIVFRFLSCFIFSVFRQMCNTSMSVSTDGAVSTSQIPASEQETLVGILSQSVTF